MDRKTKICLWIIVMGLLNFLAYTVIYMFVGGEALNGWVDVSPSGQLTYFLRSNGPQIAQQVSEGQFLYSGIHSISIWVTVAAVMLAMLTLAKDRIVSSMHRTIVRGRTFITILATIITFVTIVITIWLSLQFADKFRHPTPRTDVPTTSTSPKELSTNYTNDTNLNNRTKNAACRVSFRAIREISGQSV